MHILRTSSLCLYTPLARGQEPEGNVFLRSFESLKVGLELGRPRFPEAFLSWVLACRFVVARPDLVINIRHPFYSSLALSSSRLPPYASTIPSSRLMLISTACYFAHNLLWFDITANYISVDLIIHSFLLFVSILFFVSILAIAFAWA
ncbi:hypothetical protein HGRIS_000921 [Hohenbuehelia grisea]|uniref:Uncharacterized protein n=1 Tax=Hohenbuehelia grisea TaxID=104357 RepID=A0ABR3IQ63_9AGAR